jgi:hypothetical protein
VSYDGVYEALRTDEDVIDAHFKLIMVLLRQEGPYTLPSDDSYADPEITSWVGEARSVYHYALEGANDQDYLVGRLEELGGYTSPFKVCCDCERELTEDELQSTSEAGEADAPLCDGCADGCCTDELERLTADDHRCFDGGAQMRVHGNPNMSAESLEALKDIGRTAAAKLGEDKR